MSNRPFLQKWAPHTSQHELAIWQPAWPTVENNVSQVSRQVPGLSGIRVSDAWGELRTVQANDFSHLDGSRR
jgi:hypothetical protein